MDEQMDLNKEHLEQEGGSYQTGSTKPPKKRGGLIALLLVGVILLGGLSCALGVMNIRMFQKIKENDLFQIFIPKPTETQEVTEPMLPTSSGISVDLRPVPTEPSSPESITGPLTYPQIYAKNIPSVVSITVEGLANTVYGTGVVLSANGYIVTNCHVVENAGGIRVQLTDGRIMEAFLVGADKISDLAVLYIEAQDLIPAEFGDSSVLQVGEIVAAIGDPLGPDFRGTMTEGIVSAINRNIVTDGRTMTLIQTNAALNAGNSGGPLINGYGQVVGINTMKISIFTDGAGVEGLGFAIPSTTVKEIVDQLIAQGFVSGRPSLRISCDTVGILSQKYYGLPAGVQVTDIQTGCAAAQAGLQDNDIITAFNGVKIETTDELSNALYNCKVGQTVTIELYRHSDRQELTIQVTLQEAQP